MPVCTASSVCAGKGTAEAIKSDPSGVAGGVRDRCSATIGGVLKPYGAIMGEGHKCGDPPPEKMMSPRWHPLKDDPPPSGPGKSQGQVRKGNLPCGESMDLRERPTGKIARGM